MTMIRQIIPAEINQLGDDEIEVVMSTASLARDGHVLVPQGCRLENYRTNPIVLWSHNPDLPIGNSVEIAIEADKIRARIRFAPLGISAKADEVRGLMKSGVVRAVSVGFDPIDGEPLDAKKPRGGQRFNDWELLELSAVSVPSDTGALVTARANGDNAMEIETTDGAPAPKTRDTRTAGKRVAVLKMERGLYQVANIAYMLEELGWQVDMAQWEASIEGDNSKVPGLLAEALYSLGDAFLAMAAEELAELLAGKDVEPLEANEDVVLVETERAHIRDAKSPGVRGFRRALAHAKLRAGKTLSTETVRCLRDARDLHDEAMDLHRSAMRKHKDGLSALDDLIDRAGVSDPESGDGQANEETSSERSAPALGQSNAGDQCSADYRRRQADLLSMIQTH